MALKAFVAFGRQFVLCDCKNVNIMTILVLVAFVYSDCKNAILVQFLSLLPLFMRM